MQCVTLPWPPRVLSPNVSKHYMVLAKAKKEYKEACMWEAKAQGIKSIDANSVHVSIEFFKPTRRRMDLDNALASIKSGLDGVSDVLGVDDSKWTLSIRFSDQIGGMVKLSIEHE